MFPTIAKQYDETRAKAQALVDRVKSEERDFTEPEREEFDGYIAEAKSLSAVLTRVKESADALSNLGDVDATGHAPQGKTQSPGEMFVKSAEWQTVLANNPGGFSKDSPIVMPRVTVGGIKTLVTDPHLTPAAVNVFEAPISPLDVLSAFTVVPDAGDAIKHITATFTNAAAAVAEGIAKPESALAFSEVPLNAATLAHWIPVTEQALRRNSILETMINTFMIRGVHQKVGDAAVTAMAGWSGLQLQAYVTDLRTTIRKAVTKAAQYGVPSGILLNAFDAETVDLEAIASVSLPPGSYYAQAQTVWRLPVFTSYQLPAGFAYVGDLKQVMVYLDGGIQVATGWINAQFTENKRTLRAEQDAITGVGIAPAIVKADLTP